MERANFFVVKKVDNRTTVDTETFYPVLTQICVTTHTMIKFTQNSDLNESVSKILTKNHNDGE